MALLALQDASAGIANVNMLTPNAGGDTVNAGVRAAGWDLPVVLLVRNTDAATKTVTIDGVPYVIPATTGLGLVPVYAGVYGMVKAIAYSAVAGVTIAPLRLHAAP